MTSIQAGDRIDLRLDTSEADAVLRIVAKHRAQQPVTDADWQQVFATEPYRRLKQREADMQRSFTDEEFQEFVLSDELVRRGPDLRRTLDEWRSRDLEAGARRVLDYLPSRARIHAAVYPVIKPRTNSFVYDPSGDAAIFLYLDPEQSAAQFENTVSHELHHIGFASIEGRLDSITADLPDKVRTAVEWMTAFGEGFAMLAAAGGPDIHPHAVSPPEERARWDRDMANFNRDLRSLEEFFRDVIDGTLASEEEIRQRAFSFFGIQGPWYTVGYRMAVIVERRYGRPTLIDCMVDPRRLLARYNAAATEANARGGESLALWSPRFLQQIGASNLSGQSAEDGIDRFVAAKGHTVEFIGTTELDSIRLNVVRVTWNAGDDWDLYFAESTGLWYGYRANPDALLMRVTDYHQVGGVLTPHRNVVIESLPDGTTRTHERIYSEIAPNITIDDSMFLPGGHEMQELTRNPPRKPHSQVKTPGKREIYLLADPR